MIHFRCPHCNEAIKIPDDALGKKCRCPGCKGISQVTTSQPVPPAVVPAVNPSTPIRPPSTANGGDTKKPPQAAVGCFVLSLLIVAGATVGPCRIFPGASYSPTPNLSDTSSSAKDPRKSECNKVVAWTAAQEFVRQRLRSPGSATFGGVFGGDFQNPENCVTVTGEKSFVAKGWVDSQNGFGALIRSTFTCKVRYEGNGKWVCEDLELEER